MPQAPLRRASNPHRANMMIRVLRCLSTVLMGAAFSASAQQYPFQNPQLPAEERISDLLSRMTLEEKVFCFGIDPSVPRLGVKGTGHIEGLSGVALGGVGGWAGDNPPVPTTQFPEEKGMGQSWDPALLQLVGAQEGYEARYAAQSPKWAKTRVWRIVGGYVVRGPNADMARDPRWGRNGESYGEDAFLNGTMSVAFIRGLQGDDPRYWQAAALMKHFLANENEENRRSTSAKFDESLFYDYYSKPFRMGIREGGAQAVMAAYNAWNGLPMTTHPALKDVLEREWGLNGIVSTDRDAMLNAWNRHHFYKNAEESLVATIHAGINQYLDKWTEPMNAALKDGSLKEKDLDENLRGVFRVMIKLGQLDPPGPNRFAKIGMGGEPEPWQKPEAKSLNRQIARESIVLLKNSDAILPLDEKKLHRIALIGPDVGEVLFGFYAGAPAYTLSIAEGIKARAGNGIAINVVSGKATDSDLAIKAAKEADVAIVVVGNHPTCRAPKGKSVGDCMPSEAHEGHDRRSINLEQEALIKRVFAANPRTIVVVRTSFPYAIRWTDEHVPAVLTMAHSSDEEGNALADVLFGDYNPSGHLTQTWPRDIADVAPILEYDIRKGGETYMYSKAKPLYAFGHGLSYTQFAYSHIAAPRQLTPANSTMKLTVKNVGERQGDEVVQVYASYEGEAAKMHPSKWLVGFQRVSLKAGESKSVSIPLTADALAFYNTRNKRFELDGGTLRLSAGPSSDDLKASAIVQVKQAAATMP